MTLFELLVALALLGLLATVAVASLPTAAAPRDPASERARRLRGRLAAARHEAIRSGRAVTVYVTDQPNEETRRGDVGSAVIAATAQPDGSIVVDAAGAPAVAVDRLDGEVRAEIGNAAR